MGPGRDVASAVQGRRWEKAMQDGWHVRYDGQNDQFVASKDVLAAHTMDDLLTEMERAQGREPET